MQDWGETMQSLLRMWMWLRKIQEYAVLLYFAWQHPETPGYLRAMLALLLLYIVSPIDFLPDYIPFLGIADDAVVLPMGIQYITRLLPNHIRSDCLQMSKKLNHRIPYLIALVAIIGFAWIILILYGVYTLISH